MKRGAGRRPRDFGRHYATLCIICGRPARWNKLTCDDTCERAKRGRRTREEQFWRDYITDKVTI